MAVDFYRHSLGEDEKAAVRGVLDSLFLTTGQRVYAFEKAFEEYLGVPAVCARRMPRPPCIFPCSRRASALSTR